MAAEPNVVEAPLLPPTPPTIISCPIGFVKYKSACFKFSSHSSYEMAKSGCESVGARLASIDSMFGKYIRDQVRSMGGNDFWIGSFINKGRVYRQKGRTSCPIMRGQMINDALYGLVDCNSANRYICQKYGPRNDGTGTNQNSFGGLPNPVSTAKSTTQTSVEAEGGGMSPVIYVVITVIVLIIALIALKLLVGKYFRDKKKKAKALSGSKPKSRKSAEAKGIVISPKCRKEADSKRTSIDSAVPPSNPSVTLEKKPEKRPPIQDANELYRMGRPRVNGSQPSRKPPGVEEEIAYHHQQQQKQRTMIYGEEPIFRQHRRTHSDPRSDYTDDYDYRQISRRRRHSAYSSHSSMESDSDDSGSSGNRYGPKKVYQRQASRSQMGRDLQHYHADPNRGAPSQRDRHHDHEGRHRKRNRSRGQSSQDNVYRNNGHREEYERYESGRGARYIDFGKNDHVYGGRQAQMSTVSARVQNLSSGRQYFPEPHRLVSWANMGELNDFSTSAEPLVRQNTRSFPREPIRVSRQIHQTKEKSKKLKKSQKKEENHIYESLDETKKNKMLKKASERNKSLKRREGHHMQRASVSRASLRSIASIQSRRLPTPPVSEF